MPLDLNEQLEELADARFSADRLAGWAGSERGQRRQLLQEQEQQAQAAAPGESAAGSGSYSSSWRCRPRQLIRCWRELEIEEVATNGTDLPVLVKCVRSGTVSDAIEL